MNISLTYKQLEKILFYLLICILTLSIISLINIESIRFYFYFFLFGLLLILILDKKEVKSFAFPFLINGLFSVLYIAIQSYVYPNTFGTTSPLGSWTDDSYFFALCADTIPNDMYIRDYYWEYTHFYTEIIKFFTPFKIHFPLDVIFFQSCIAGILSIYTKQFAEQITNNVKIGKYVYYLCTFSPFFLMHGGAILMRDTFVAALFMLTLTSLNRKRYLVAIIAMGLQFPLRIGTGFILLFVCFFIYLPMIKSFFMNRKYLIIFSIIIIVYFSFYIEIILSYTGLDAILIQKGISLAGREVFEALEEGNNGNVIFLFIQKQNILIKSILSGLYIFLYPFLNFKGIFTSAGLDIRTLLLNFIYPIILIGLNAWFFAAYLSSRKQFKSLLISLILGFILIGVFSLQTRHKTILLPLYYIVVAIGYEYSTRSAKKIGFLLSSIWLLIQVVLTFR
jgi:hypothetical protein